MIRYETKKPHECAETCPFVPSSLKRTEGHYTGRISLNSYVDLRTYLFQQYHLLGLSKVSCFNAVKVNSC